MTIEMEQKEEPGTEEDVILELAIEYVLGNGRGNGYPSDLVKDRSRGSKESGDANSRTG